MVNFELLDRAPPKRAPNNPWPEWPRIYPRRLLARRRKAKSAATIRASTTSSPRSSSTTNGRVHGREDRASRLVEARRESAVQRSPRQRESLAGRSGAAGHRLPRPGARRSPRCWASTLRSPRGNWETFKAEHGPFATNARRRLRRRRLPPRSIARRVGDQRRPRRAPRDRRVPDGHSTLPAPGIGSTGKTWR